MRSLPPIILVAVILATAATTRFAVPSHAQSAEPPARETPPADPKTDETRERDDDCEEEELAALLGEPATPAATTPLKTKTPGRRSKTLTRAARGVRQQQRDLVPTRSIKVSSDLIVKAMEVARDINPATARRLEELRQKDPAAFQAAMATTGRRLLGLAELKRRDKQLYMFKLSEIQYEARVKRTAERLRQARREGSEGKAEIIESQLRTELKMLVALELPARALYLKRLKEHVQKLEAEIHRAANNFENTVEERYQRLMEEPDESANPVLAGDPPS